MSIENDEINFNNDSSALNQEIKQNYYLIYLMLVGFWIFLIIMIGLIIYVDFLVYLL